MAVIITHIILPRWCPSFLRTLEMLSSCTLILLGKWQKGPFMLVQFLIHFKMIYFTLRKFSLVEVLDLLYSHIKTIEAKERLLATILTLMLFKRGLA